jgi:hypothetical protein
MDGVVVLWGKREAAVKKLEQNNEFALIRVSVFGLTEERWNEFVDGTIDGPELKAAIAITNMKSVSILITFERRKVSLDVHINRQNIEIIARAPV